MTNTHALIVHAHTLVGNGFGRGVVRRFESQMVEDKLYENNKLDVKICV